MAIQLAGAWTYGASTLAASAEAAEAVAVSVGGANVVVVAAVAAVVVASTIGLLARVPIESQDNRAYVRAIMSII